MTQDSSEVLYGGAKRTTSDLFKGGLSHGRSIHALIYSREPSVSVLGKVYLLVSLGLVVLGLVWAVMTLRDNTAWVPVTLWIPAWTPEGPWRAQHYDVSASALLAGWFTTAGFMAVYAIRAPFRIRAAAIAQRRLRALEREVLELRTLPLRQAEEDDMLAAEARLDVGQQRVMQSHYFAPEPAPGAPGASATPSGLAEPPAGPASPRAPRFGGAP